MGGTAMSGQNQKPYHYVAIGDSLTVGLGSDLFSPGFVGRYAEDASNSLHRHIVVDKFARSGSTSGEILNALYVPAICDALAASDIVTITAGANDLIDAAEAFLTNQNEEQLFLALETSTTNIKKMIERIHDLHDPAHYCYAMRLLNLYNPFPNIPLADPWIQRFNARLAEFERFPHIKVADIYSAFQGRQQELLTPHGIHPNDHGYEVMADVLNRLGYTPLI